MSGKPLRFFGMTLAGWVAVRAVMLWLAAGPGAIPRSLVPAAYADSAPRPATPLPETTATASFNDAKAKPPFWPALRPVMIRAPRFRASAAPSDLPVPPTWPAAATQSGPVMMQPLLAPPSPTQLIAQPPPDRWSASAWFVLRDGRGIAPGLGGGQLGGGQAGLRVAYAIDDARRMAIVGRIASPLRGKGREAALGVEWRPTRLPVRLVAEYRASLDGGGSGPAAGIIAGTGPAPLALGFDLETYGQAGVIRRHRTEAFAEGAARLSRPVVKLGSVKVDLGLGGWGGAQRGAQRLDLGASLGVRLPVTGKSLRLSLDWRQRIAGGARPGSGPVLVIGSDF